MSTTIDQSGGESVGFRLRLADVAARTSTFSNADRAAPWAPIVRSASIPSSTAARRKSPASSSASTRAATAAASLYRVAAAQRADTIAYLRAREQATMVYRECWRSVWLEDDPGQRVQALCYMVDRGHEQYAGRLSLDTQLHYVRQGHGRSGNNRDYVLETVEEIERQGYRDPDLHLLAERLKGRARARLIRRPASRCASATSRAVAVSISSCSRAKKTFLSSPGGIGSRISTTTVPGRRRIERRGQNSPELSATGRHGTPPAHRDTRRRACSAARRRPAAACPPGR